MKITNKPEGKINLLLGCGIAFGILILIGIVAAIAGGGGTNKSQPTKVGDTNTNSQPDTANTTPTAPSTQTFYLNEQIKLDDKVLTVFSVADYKSTNEFIKPKDGNKFVIADVSLENQGKEAIDINPFDFKLQDKNNYSYQSSFSDKTPAVNAEPIQPTRKVRGFVTFEVPTDTKEYELVYTPSFWSSKQIIVKTEVKK